MRIFTAVRHSKDPSYYYGSLWSRNFHPALRALGHDVVESQVDLLPVSRFMGIAGDFTPQELEARARVTEAILDEVKAAHQQQRIDLFLSYFYNAHADPGLFDDLRDLGIRSVNFFCNSIYQFELVAAIAAKASHSWHPEKEARASYIAARARPVWVQMGADPDLYRPVADIVPAQRAAFIGQRYADRDRWLAAMLDAGLPLDIYGSGWRSGEGDGGPAGASDYLGRLLHKPGSLEAYGDAARQAIKRDGLRDGLKRLWRQWQWRNDSRDLTPKLQTAVRGSVAMDGFADTVARHAVHFNLANVWADGRPGSALIPHVRLRDFELPMCRACYLTAQTDEIAEFYEPGREIDTYASKEELIDKTRFYLGNQDAAERLREAGFRRARADHTWTKRFVRLFDAIGLARP